MPASGNLDELDKVWKGMKSHDEEVGPLKPASLLATLTPTCKEFTKLASTWKLGNKERNLGTFISMHRDAGYDPSTNIQYFQDLLVEKVELDWVLELLRYCNWPEEGVAMLREWEVPMCPVRGLDMQGAGVPGGPRMGVVLKRLRTLWKESGYLLTKDELMKGVGPEKEGEGSEVVVVEEGKKKRRKFK